MCPSPARDASRWIVSNVSASRGSAARIVVERTTRASQVENAPPVSTISVDHRDRRHLEAPARRGECRNGEAASEAERADGRVEGDGDRRHDARAHPAGLPAVAGDDPSAEVGDALVGRLALVETGVAARGLEPDPVRAAVLQRESAAAAGGGQPGLEPQSPGAQVDRAVAVAAREPPADPPAVAHVGANVFAVADDPDQRGRTGDLPGEAADDRLRAVSSRVADEQHAGGEYAGGHACGDGDGAFHLVPLSVSNCPVRETTPARAALFRSSRAARAFSRSPRAGGGDRTRITSLEGWGSTIELRPRDRRPRDPQ